jgi:hypothetical protein
VEVEAEVEAEAWDELLLEELLPEQQILYIQLLNLNVRYLAFLCFAIDYTKK